MRQRFETIVEDDGTRYTYLVGDNDERVPIETSLTAEKWVEIAMDLERCKAAADYWRAIRSELKVLQDAADAGILQERWKERESIIRTLVSANPS